MNPPKKISPCPIIDALLEIRFIPNINQNAVFGLIYNALQKDFPKVDNLPVLQIPEPIRNIDPNLKFKPYYKISNEEYVVQIGPDVLSIASFPQYAGWKKFSTIISDVLERIENTTVIKNVSRVGIRYINFFDYNIFDKINLNVQINNSLIDYRSTVVKTEILQDEYISTLQIANSVSNKSKVGSVIDIDTSINVILDDFFKNKEDIINKGHQFEKELFFNLLKDDFLKSLNPEY